MSGKATAAVQRPAMSSLLQRILSTVMDWFRNWLDLRSGSSSAPKPSRRTVALESLEPRLLMSADLVGSIAAAPIPDDVLPSDKFNVSVIVRNVGAHTAVLTPVVRLYASNTGQVDSQSIALGESSIRNSIIRANQSVSVNVTADASRIGDTGNYSLFAVVDATNRIQESNENNNVALAGQPLHVVWSFGAVPGHSNSDSITLTDDFGTRVTFTLTGGGRGDVVLGDDGFDLHLTGTSANSVLKITASGGRGYTTLGDVLVDGAIKQIEAAKADLAGSLSIGGTVRSILLGDIGDGASISIAGAGVPVKLTAGEVAGASIQSASGFESIAIEAWLPGAGGRGVIAAPSIGKLLVDGAFGADLDLTGAASGLTLAKVTIDGRITGGAWNVGGSAGPISAKSIEAGWQGSFQGAVQKVSTERDLGGTLAAPSIGTLDVGRNMVGARLLIGAISSGQFGPGFIGEMNVDGAIIDSTVLVGVDPVDGSYDNGDDVIVGGTASRIQKLSVAGALLGTTSFTAGAFPTWVTINNRSVRSSSVPQLHTATLDGIAPQIGMALLHDTGLSDTDRVTSNPAMVGQVTEAGTLAVFSAALDSTADADFVDIRALLQPDGQFVLDAATIALIGGGPLSEGPHALNLRAVDGSGNVDGIFQITFVLDTAAPALSATLDPASDSGVAGDSLTRDAFVTISGTGDANSLVELAGTGRSTFADAGGHYSFADVFLLEGANAFEVRATDLAGNQTATSLVIARDSTAPSLVAGLAHDTGPSSFDRWTSDPSLAGHLNDVSGVVSLTVLVDGVGPTEFQAAPAVDSDFVIDGSVIGSTLSDGLHVYHLRATDAAGNVSMVDVDFILDRSAPTPPQFDLAPESDTGVTGDQHTEEAVVSLTGLADFEIDLHLNGVAVTPAWMGNVFRIDNVALAAGENILTLRATDPAGNQSELFTRSIFRDEAPVEDGLFPDLVVSGIHTQVLSVDEFGVTNLRVSWTTSNEGLATAVGRHGAWAESVLLSNDDTPWNGDMFLGNLKVTSTLAPGASEVHSIDVFIQSWVAPGYRVFVVTDDETSIIDPDTFDYEYFANEVAEKDVGEFNNLVIQDIDLGIVPDTLPSSGPGLLLDGTAVGGAIDVAGESDVYTFSLGAPTRLYFDSLSEQLGMSWTLRTAGGDTVYSRNFAASDAFGIGTANPLLNLAAGDYELVVSNTAGETGDYGFRLLNPDLAAFHHLVLDGGPVLREMLERGDWTDIYQFEATAGTNYVAGGANDWAIDGALYWRMFDPEGNQIWAGTTSPSDEDVFDLTGTYTLMIEGRLGRTDPAMYNAYVFTPQDRHIALTTGQRVQGFLDSPGQVNTYHFTVDEATVAFFDGYLESNGPYFNWTLQGPGGIVDAGSTRSDTTDFTGSARLLNLEAGDYSLKIEGFDNAAGWYNFGLFDLVHDAGTPLSLDQPAIGALVPGFNSTLYRFDGAAGQEVTIDLNTMDPDWISYDPAHWMVVDFAGSIVAQGQAGTPAQATLDSGGSYSLLIQGRQYNWFPIDYSLTVSDAGQEPVIPVFDLAPESDTGVAGDHRTTLEQVILAGIAAPNATVSLAFTPLTTVADAAGVFRFYNVTLGLGGNNFTVYAQDAQGNQTQFTQTIFRDEVPTVTGQPDLAVLSIDRQVLGVNEFGDVDMLVSWVTVSQGAVPAHGQSGYWIESLWISQFDLIPFSGDDMFLGNVFITEDLGADYALRTSSLNVTLPDWIAAGGRFYVVVDDGNQVFEKTAGEYNNTTVEDRWSGMQPPPIAPSGTVLSLSGEATAGTLESATDVDVYTFHLNTSSLILFDALHSDADAYWSIYNSDGLEVQSGSFAHSDAFGSGIFNPMRSLEGGSYQLQIRSASPLVGDYAFRLLDVAAAASHDLALDGGALLGQTLARGDQTNVYQFQATAGQAYVVGGMADNTVEGALYWRLFDPQGHQIWSGTTEPSDVAYFQDSGTYTLTVEGNINRTDPTRYNVFVFTPQDRVIPLALGNHVQGFLDSPGQVNTHTFTLNAPTSLFLDGRLDSNGLYFDWVLEGAGGIESQGTLWQDSANGADPLLHLAAGSYTLKINAQGDASGWYNFKLMDVLHDAAPALAPGVPVQPFVYPGFESQLYRFDGTAGSQASISLTSLDPEWYVDVARWTLIDPQGNTIASGLPSPDAAVFDLATSGTWTILVQGRQANWEPLQYALTLA